MRELKFRAWDDGELLEDVTPVANGDNNAFPNLAIVVFEANGETDGIRQVDVVEQYTGLKDKNGREIYEGDILGGIWESGFISWCEKCKQFQYHSADIGCMTCSGDVHWCEIVEDDGKLEVIGNIHENPELLEERNENS